MGDVRHWRNGRILVIESSEVAGGTETFQRHSYDCRLVVCLKEQFYSVLTSLYKRLTFSVSISVSWSQDVVALGIPTVCESQLCFCRFVDHPGYLVNLLEGQAWEVWVSAMAKVVVLGCIVTCIVLVSCRLLISF